MQARLLLLACLLACLLGTCFILPSRSLLRREEQRTPARSSRDRTPHAVCRRGSVTRWSAAVKQWREATAMDLGVVECKPGPAPAPASRLWRLARRRRTFPCRSSSQRERRSARCFAGPRGAGGEHGFGEGRAAGDLARQRVFRDEPSSRTRGFSRLITSSPPSRAPTRGAASAVSRTPRRGFATQAGRCSECVPRGARGVRVRR